MGVRGERVGVWRLRLNEVERLRTEDLRFLGWSS